MAPRLTPDRMAALRPAAAHPTGNISSLIREEADGTKVWLKASDELALEALGYAASICDHGHINTAPSTGSPNGAPHRGCPHIFRITKAGRQAIPDAT
ncbi:hypothetical protein [Streptomyces sp. NPDC001970]